MGTWPELQPLVDLFAEIDLTYPLEKTDESFAAIQDRETVGTIVVPR